MKKEQPSKSAEDRTELFTNIPMTEILERLEYVDSRFPLELLNAVVLRKVEAIPHLLYVLDEARKQADALKEDPEYELHIFAMYLLAQFRETKAYQSILGFFSLPGDLSLDLTGYVGTEDLHRILTSVSGGDSLPVQAVIENSKINEFVRCAAIRSMVGMVLNDLKPRSEVIDYFRSLFDKGIAQEDYDDVYSGLVTAILDMEGVELREEIEKAYDDELINPGEVSPQDVSRRLDRNAGPDQRPWLREKYSLVTDIADEMTWMSWKVDPRTSRTNAASRKIDRHGPCPCGSGLIYKKCCEKKAAT